MDNFQSITANAETLAAFLQKHRIFAIRADVEPQEISREEALKMGALMQGMSDESPLRAIEAGK